MSQVGSVLVIKIPAGPDGTEFKDNTGSITNDIKYHNLFFSFRWNFLVFISNHVFTFKIYTQSHPYITRQHEIGSYVMKI